MHSLSPSRGVIASGPPGLQDELSYLHFGLSYTNVPTAVPSSGPSRYNRTCCGCGQVSSGISWNRLEGMPRWQPHQPSYSAEVNNSPWRNPNLLKKLTRIHRTDPQRRTSAYPWPANGHGPIPMNLKRNVRIATWNVQTLTAGTRNAPLVWSITIQHIDSRAMRIQMSRKRRMLCSRPHRAGFNWCEALG